MRRRRHLHGKYETKRTLSRLKQKIEYLEKLNLNLKSTIESVDSLIDKIEEAKANQEPPKTFWAKNKKIFENLMKAAGFVKVADKAVQLFKWLESQV